MDIKVGIAESNRELVIVTKESADAVSETVRGVIGGTGTLELTDEKGRQFLIPAARIAYVEIGVNESRTVGFSNNK